MSWWHAGLGPLPKPGAGTGPELVLVGRVRAKRVCAATSFVDVDGLVTTAIAPTLLGPEPGSDECAAPAPALVQVRVPQWREGKDILIVMRALHLNTGLITPVGGLAPGDAQVVLNATTLGPAAAASAKGLSTGQLLGGCGVFHRTGTGRCSIRLLEPPIHDLLLPDLAKGRATGDRCTVPAWLDQARRLVAALGPSAAADRARLPPLLPGPPEQALRGNRLDEPVPLCRHWVRGGSCSNAARCYFRHHFVSAAEEATAVPAARRVAAKQAQAIELERHPDDPYRAGTKGCKQRRAELFAAWLLRWLPGVAEEGRGWVLDVAGGKGRLAAALAAKGARCVVVDPCSEAEFEPKHLAAAAAAGGELRRLRRPFDSGVLAELEPGSRIECVAGMHPDQATEPAVEVALGIGVPFAVVPCCVFPSLFLDRRVEALGDEPRCRAITAEWSPGTRPGPGTCKTVAVRTYNQFVRYLQIKTRSADRECAIDFLPFRGKNAVLYSRHVLPLPSDGRGPPFHPSE